MRHRILRQKNNILGGLHTSMRRTNNYTNVVDYPIDRTQVMSDLCSFDSESDMLDMLSGRAEKHAIHPEKDARPSHPCDHRRTFATYKENVVAVASGVSGGYTYDITYTGNLPGYATSVLGFSYDAVSDIGNLAESLDTHGASPGATYIDWEALENDFLDMSKNILQKEVLLGETLAQPQLFIDAVKFLVSPARGMQRLAKYAVKRYGKRVRKSSTGDVARRVLKDAANSTLMFNFAVKPAISDIRGVLKAHRVVSNRLLYLKENMGKYVPVRVRQSSFPFEKDHEYTGEFNPAFATLYKSPSERHLHAAIGANFRVRRDLTLEANYNAYAQYFGIGQVVGLLWELVPFSFVIDWVSNVQERIQKFSQVHSYNPFCDSRGFCASLKQIDRETIRLSSGYLPAAMATFPESVSGTELASVMTTRYSRFLDLPESRPLFDLSGVGLSQIINGASLLIQKLVKNR